MAGARRGRKAALEAPAIGAGAASQWEPMVNVAHNPEMDVTLADVEKLLDWMDRRWGEAPRGPHEVQRWWQRLSAVRRVQLRIGCQVMDPFPDRPTPEQFARAIISGDPNWRPSARSSKGE